MVEAAFLGFDVQASIAQGLNSLTYMVYMFFEGLLVNEDTVELGCTAAVKVRAEKSVDGVLKVK